MCAKRKCGHIYPEDEAVPRPNPKEKGWFTEHCPKCGHHGHFAIDADGKRVRLSEWKPSPWPNALVSDPEPTGPASKDANPKGSLEQHVGLSEGLENNPRR